MMGVEEGFGWLLRRRGFRVFVFFFLWKGRSVLLLARGGGGLDGGE